MKSNLLIALLAFSIATPALAQTQNSAPLEISADNALEWHRDKKQYIAKGNAIAEQDGTKINADTLTANYTSSENSSTEITEIIANGNVIITTEDGVITGDNAIYLVKEGHATITGDTLTLTGEKLSAQASKSFEYWTEKQKFKAIGNAQIIEADRTLKADEITAWFMTSDEQSNEAQNGLKQADAIGKVIIETGTDIASGDTGHYDGIKEIVTLEGNVKILRDKNILNGTKAIVNLKTGISQLFGDKNGGRVTGKFFPESKK